MISVAVLLSLAAAVLRLVVAQTQCGGTQYTPGTVNFTLECYNAIQSCVAQFEANASLVNCQDPAGNVFLQQEAALTAAAGDKNDDAVIAFQDIIDLCIIAGQTSGTWGYSDNQWYWVDAESVCYTNDSSVTNVVPTRPAPFCIQDRDSTLPDCYPQPNSNAGPLKVLRTAQTATGFTSSSRGWNTYGIQALENGSAIIPSFKGQSGLDYTQQFVETQCGVLAQDGFREAGYVYCSLDSGWQAFDAVDENGRIIYNNTRFNIPELASWLHARNLKLGLYIIPGVPCLAQNKTILGTDITVGSVWNGNYDQIFCDWNFSKNGVQQWHDSVVDLWADWGVDMIKLDYLTPGSPQNGANLVCDNSAAAEMYLNAIKKSGRQMRLHFSWKLCRNETWLPIWSGLGDSMRTDQDINNYGFNTLLAWSTAQRAIDNYRQYIGLQAQRNVLITMYPDMDNLLTVNPENLTGVNDTMRITVMNHWLGAAANLIIGGDLTQIDALGSKLVTSSESIAAANFFAQYPMQPRNPGTGNNLAKQLQAWIGGPSNNEAYVLIANYGPDQGSGGFGTKLTGIQNVTVSLNDFGIAGRRWVFTDIWQGNCSTVSNSYTAYLDEGASQLLRLTVDRW